MDLGSGLTFDTHTVNGKITTGIFFGNKGKKVTQHLPIRSTVDPDDDGANNSTVKSSSNSTVTRPSNSTVTRPRNQRKLRQKIERVNSATSVASGGSNKSDKKGKQQKTQQTKKTSNDVGDGRATKKPKPQDAVATEEAEVSTKYVTLTQGQLSTILGLVKSKNDVDISGIFEDNDAESKKSDDKPQKDGECDSSECDIENKDDKSSPKTGNKTKESITNLLEKKDSDPKLTKKNEKSEQKSSNQKNRPGSEENAKSANIEKKDESSNSKSFFLGATIPRAGASSAKKRENQQRWREELEQQRDEQRKRKENERTARFKQLDDELWTKHFDTMLPTKDSPRVPDASTTTPSDSMKISQSDSDIKKQLQISTNHDPEPGNSLRNSIDNSEIGDFVSTMAPQRSSYLRTMTSLLDPAQIEAIEVKRRKQEEHRRDIEAQVAERKRKKEEENEHRRQLEEEEDRRLAAERDFFTQRAENEKARQQRQENLREQKTKELYQQMKNAEESALRDKLARREQNLRTKGHDTSRLERTHQMALDMNQKVEPLHSHREENPPSVPVTNHQFSTERSSKDSQQPLAVTAHTDQGPIKLEISLNHRHDGQQVVELGVQTDSRLTYDNRTFRIGSDSDTETEYLQLPRKTKNTTEKSSKHNFEKNQRNEKPSRTDAKQKRNQPRPVWGVGEKRQNFVPASQRYTREQQKHDLVMRRREERLQEQQERDLAMKRRNDIQLRQDQARERRDLAIKKQKENAQRQDLARERRQEKKERIPLRPVREEHPEKSKFTSSKNHGAQRSKSPVVPAVRTRQNEKRHPDKISGNQRPTSGIHATTDNAKYRSEKHTSESPVPQTNEFVEYRRTTAVLDPSIPQSRPETSAITSTSEFVQDRKTNGGDPLLNPDIVWQHDRQERILREISILRQGLLLKQREVAGYPAAMTQHFQPLGGAGSPTNFVLAGGGNLPERTNDTP